MNPAALVSIVMPLFDDEETVEQAVRSALAQTCEAIEVICVDDASTDATAAVVARLAAEDPRVRLIRHELNLSAFQARRTGVIAAAAAHILFLDGDDELAPDAAEKALAAANRADTDIVGFGVTVVEKDGRTGGGYELRLAPRHSTLHGDEVLSGLFPLWQPAQGQLWRYLFRTSLLRDAYDAMPPGLFLRRANDLPLLFVVALLARSFVSIPDKLYRYHFGRGGSGHDIDSVSRAEFYVAAIESIDGIRSSVESLATRSANPDLIFDTYTSVRLSVIGYVCTQLLDRSAPAVLPDAMAYLYTITSPQEVIVAVTRFHPRALSTLKFHLPRLGGVDGEVRNVLLATSSLRTGGVSAVIAAQAKHLSNAGFRVLVVARSSGSEPSAVPPEAEFVQLTGANDAERLRQWGDLCRSHAIDIVIDHQVFYTGLWPEYALAARAEGAATIGWLHTFVGRPIYEGNARLSYIERCSNVLSSLIALSPLDVAYFKLRGVRHVAFLPNPPSSLLLQPSPAARSAPRGRVELVWLGRLEQRIKQVFTLIDVGEALSRRGLDYRLTVVGPDWQETTAAKFNATARKRGLADRVTAIGALRGEELRERLDRAHVFISTSIIEGYQLTIAEAQARGLPVVMYELPWLLLVQDNPGIMSVPQGEPDALADRVASLASDPIRYEEMSRASLDAADRVRTHDFGALYRALVDDSLPAEFSPEPTAEDASRLLELFVFYAERSKASGRPTLAITGETSGWKRRTWARLSPIGRRLLGRYPGLRPFAHRAKRWLRAG